MSGISALGVAGVLSAGWGWLATWLGPALGWVDSPDDPALKAHGRPAVPLGGVGLFLGVHVVMLASGEFDRPLFAASGLLLGIGLVDDRWSVSPRLRLAVEATAAVMLGVAVGDSPQSVVFIALLVVVAVNAVNLYDGLDGLAGLAGAVTAVGLALLASGRGITTTFALALVGVLIGFLVWNWHPARVFLGDNGAYVLAGFLVFGMARTSRDTGELTIASATLGVFLLDLAVTLVRRVLARQPMFSGDRLHLYDRIAQQGWSVPAVALASGGVQTVFVILVLVADRLLDFPMAVALLAGVGVMTVLVLVRVLAVIPRGD